MAWFVVQSLLVIVLAYLLGVATGWLLPRATRQRDEPAATDAPAPVVRDDRLERIEGIGPKFAAALRDAGIRTFEQLAEASDERKRAALETAGLSFAPSLVTWSRQARLLADGDETAFAELTEQLVAGREMRLAEVLRGELPPAEMPHAEMPLTELPHVELPRGEEQSGEMTTGVAMINAPGKLKKKDKDKKKKIKDKADEGTVAEPAR